ncbi:DUF1127 domain-containing protein [Pseudothauera rhizosphaerae]|uniref:DUF1127 domain-containing protein n=1 Tax=Pseudothauera rhizosphaerae TaxID=2565932 RepID=A0A4S4AL13_9RHOO|nr:DUF1127 domain-containing protein [Pseudothauera rhizosphaerae]THF60138.1 DUF1127 domain-containing protein [Pseudothauera rhizosphaerae]
MNTFDHALRPPVARPGTLVVAGLRAFRRTVALWMARSRQRRELHELDDRLLRDIGIRREDALIEAARPFWRA